MPIDNNFVVCVPAPEAPGLFGETAMIAAASRYSDTFHLEAHLLVSYPIRKSSAKRGQLRAASDPFIVDLKFALVEAVNLGALLAWEMQAKSGHEIEMERRFGFVQADEGHAYLQRLWVRGYWLEQIREVSKITECIALRDYVGSLENAPRIHFVK